MIRFLTDILSLIAQYKIINPVNLVEGNPLILCKR